MGEKLFQEACGVFAVIQPKGENAVTTVADGLESIQHRGQDYAGMTALTRKGLVTRRVKGLVGRLNPYLDELGSHAIIGQVRYPTTKRYAEQGLTPKEIEAKKEKLRKKGLSEEEITTKIERFIGPHLSEEEITAKNAQPIQFKDFSIAFNGNISNYEELKKRLEAEGVKFQGNVDVEVIGQLVQRHLGSVKTPTEAAFVNALRAAMKELKGSYSVVLLTRTGRLFAARDPFAYKPLVYARQGKGWAVSSETKAFEDLEFKGKMREAKPGRILSFYANRVKSFAGRKSEGLAHCAFEWVYFAHHDSKLSGIKVSKARRRLGQYLAKKGVEGDIVVPVPNSGVQPAHGIASGLGVELVHAIKRTTEIGDTRTFIAPTQEERERLSRIKYAITNPEEVRGKRVVLADDSIVRGTSMPVLVRMLREAGAKEVHITASAPQITSPCFMGINFPRREELIGWKGNPKEVLDKINDAIVAEAIAGRVVKDEELRSVLAKVGDKEVERLRRMGATLTPRQEKRIRSVALDTLRKRLGADSLTYTNITDLVKAIGLPGKLCLACFNGAYPEEEKRPLKNLAEHEAGMR